MPQSDCDTQLIHMIQALLYKDELSTVIFELHMTLPLMLQLIKGNGKTLNTIKDLPDVHKSSLDL